MQEATTLVHTNLPFAARPSCALECHVRCLSPGCDAQFLGASPPPRSACCGVCTAQIPPSCRPGILLCRWWAQFLTCPAQHASVSQRQLSNTMHYWSGTATTARAPPYLTPLPVLGPVRGALHASSCRARRISPAASLATSRTWQLQATGRHRRSIECRAPVPPAAAAAAPASGSML